MGYVAEHRLRKTWFSDERIRDLVKRNNHDRANKGDLSFAYKGVQITVEVKSLQTRSIREVEGEFRGRFQCDASDSREVVLPNRRRMKTTCLVVGEFDLLAVNLFEFEKKWRFAFAKNDELPRSRYRKYTPVQRAYLLATLMEVTWPLTPPFHEEPFALLDQIAREKTKKGGH